MQFLCFLYSAKMNFVDTDFICLVTAQMSYYTNWLIKFNSNLNISNLSLKIHI